uniref:WSN domain-containing protein n=1 Tax=Caenorhabditis tropicalis TaxID=1561998 RepID=A0A1I7UZF7_9PELO
MQLETLQNYDNKPPPDEETESGEFSETSNELDTNRFPRAAKTNGTVPAPPAKSLDTKRLDVMLNHTQTIAQMTNAISLQKSVTTTNTAFNIMAELLNLNSLKPEDLKTESDMKKMIAELRDLPNKVASQKEVEEAEKTFKILFDLKKDLEKVKRYDKWEPKETLKADLKEAEEKGFVIPLFAKLKSAFMNINTNVDNFRAYAGDAQRATFYFGDIKEKSEQITALTPDKLKSITDPVKFKSGNTAKDYTNNLQPLFHLVQSLEENKSVLSTPTQDLVTKNLAVVASFSKTVGPLLPTLSAFSSTFNNRTAIGGGRILVDTAGLPRGLTDLRIVDSLEKTHGKDEWLGTVTKVSIITDGLKPLHIFVEKVEEGFGASQIDPKAVANGASNCIDAEVVKDTTALPDLSALKTGLASIETEMDNLKKLLNNMATFAKSPEVTGLLNDLAGIAAQPDDQMTEKVDKLNAYKPAEVANMLTGANAYSADIDTKMKLVRNKATEASNEVDKILNPFEAMLGKRKTMFDCLAKLDAGQVASAQNAISLSGELRKPIPATVNADLDKLPALAAILTKVSGMGKGEMVEAMKKAWDETSDKIGSMENLSENSLTLGEATRGLLHLRELLAHRSSFEVILKEADSLGLTKELRPFNETLLAIESWAASPPDPSTPLEKLGPMYKNAAKVPGINNITLIMDTVARMEEEEKDPAKKAALGKVFGAMEDLRFYGLDFTGYHSHYEKVTPALEMVSAFYLSLMTWEAKSTGGVWGFLSYWPYGVGVIVVGGAIAFGIWSWRKKKYCFKGRKTGDDKKDDKKDGKKDKKKDKKKKKGSGGKTEKSGGTSGDETSRGTPVDPARMAEEGREGNGGGRGNGGPGNPGGGGGGGAGGAGGNPGGGAEGGAGGAGVAGGAEEAAGNPGGGAEGGAGGGAGAAGGAGQVGAAGGGAGGAIGNPGGGAGGPGNPEGAVAVAGAGQVGGAEGNPQGGGAAHAEAGGGEARAGGQVGGVGGGGGNPKGAGEAVVDGSVISEARPSDSEIDLMPRGPYNPKNGIKHLKEGYEVMNDLTEYSEDMEDPFAAKRRKEKQKEEARKKKLEQAKKNKKWEDEKDKKDHHRRGPGGGAGSAGNPQGAAGAGGGQVGGAGGAAEAAGAGGGQVGGAGGVGGGGGGAVGAGGNPEGAAGALGEGAEEAARRREGSEGSGGRGNPEEAGGAVRDGVDGASARRTGAEEGGGGGGNPEGAEAEGAQAGVNGQGEDGQAVERDGDSVKTAKRPDFDVIDDYPIRTEDLETPDETEKRKRQEKEEAERKKQEEEEKKKNKNKKKKKPRGDKRKRGGGGPTLGCTIL